MLLREIAVILPSYVRDPPPLHFLGLTKWSKAMLQFHSIESERFFKFAAFKYTDLHLLLGIPPIQISLHKYSSNYISKVGKNVYSLNYFWIRQAARAIEFKNNWVSKHFFRPYLYNQSCTSSSKVSKHLSLWLLTWICFLTNYGL